MGLNKVKLLDGVVSELFNLPGVCTAGQQFVTFSIVKTKVIVVSWNTELNTDHHVVAISCYWIKRFSHRNIIVLDTKTPFYVSSSTQPPLTILSLSIQSRTQSQSPILIPTPAHFIS